METGVPTSSEPPPSGNYAIILIGWILIYLRQYFSGHIFVPYFAKIHFSDDQHILSIQKQTTTLRTEPTHTDIYTKYTYENRIPFFLQKMKKNIYLFFLF